MSDSYHERFLRIFQRIERLDFQQAPLKGLNLSMPQAALLRCIARNPGSHAQEVAEAMGLTAPTVSVGLRKLEEDGWLRREPDPEDGRAMLHYLTDQAADVMLAIRKFRQQKAAEFLGALTRDERERLLSLLEKAFNRLENKSDS